MQFLKAEHPSGAGIQVYECPQHGLYHFDGKIDLTEGPPPTR